MAVCSSGWVQNPLVIVIVTEGVECDQKDQHSVVVQQLSSQFLRPTFYFVLNVFF